MKKFYYESITEYGHKLINQTVEDGIHHIKINENLGEYVILYICKGHFHRLDGPAIQEPNPDEYKYFILGIEISETEYKTIINNLPLFYWNNRDKL